MLNVLQDYFLKLDFCNRKKNVRMIIKYCSVSLGDCSFPLKVSCYLLELYERLIVLSYLIPLLIFTHSHTREKRWEIVFFFTGTDKIKVLFSCSLIPCQSFLQLEVKKSYKRRYNLHEFRNSCVDLETQEGLFFSERAQVYVCFFLDYFNKAACNYSSC